MPHFEIHASDVAAAKTFYAGLFGWEFSPMEGGEDASYHLIEGRDMPGFHGVRASFEYHCIVAFHSCGYWYASVRDDLSPSVR